MEELTNRQEEILDTIKKYIAKNGYPPTVREIGALLNLSSPATTHFHLNRLEKKGYIEIANRRGIIEKFPLTSISIAVVVADKRRFNNILEIGDIAAQVKHAVKTVMGSSYTIDRRKSS